MERLRRVETFTMAGLMEAVLDAEPVDLEKDLEAIFAAAEPFGAAMRVRDVDDLLPALRLGFEAVFPDAEERPTFATTLE